LLPAWDSSKALVGTDRGLLLAFAGVAPGARTANQARNDKNKEDGARPETAKQLQAPPRATPF
jgi:hypothetical protein